MSDLKENPILKDWNVMPFQIEGDCYTAPELQGKCWLLQGNVL